MDLATLTALALSCPNGSIDWREVIESVAQTRGRTLRPWQRRAIALSCWVVEVLGCLP